MKKRREAATKSGLDTLEPKIIKGISAAYDAIIRLAYQEKPEPVNKLEKQGKPNRGKLLALIDRLLDYKASVCLFVHKYAV